MCRHSLCVQGGIVTDPGSQQLAAEVAHWRAAVEALADLESVASPAAWAMVERYLQTGVRNRLSAVVNTLRGEAAALERMLRDGRATDEVRVALLTLRGRYLRAETLLDFYGDAINSRTSPALGELLAGYDVIASDSMAVPLGSIGITSPPALVYVDKGIGAAILRAGIRLWDQAHPSPAAAIKLTRHALSFPTSLLHETGHQLCALAGFNGQLALALKQELGTLSRELGSLWASWASEVAADVHAFLHAGWPPVFALANVVDGTSEQVFRLRVGDPHPVPYVRVMFNVALCRSWFGDGPWNRLAEAWRRRHDRRAVPSIAPIVELSDAAMPQIVDVCTRMRFEAFGDRSFAQLIDPRRASPTALSDFERASGATLLTSSYLRRRSPITVLAVLTSRIADASTDGRSARAELVSWVRSIGKESGVLDLSRVA